MNPKIVLLIVALLLCIPLSVDAPSHGLRAPGNTDVACIFGRIAGRIKRGAVKLLPRNWG